MFSSQKVGIKLKVVTGPLAHLFYTNIDRLAGATRSAFPDSYFSKHSFQTFKKRSINCLFHYGNVNKLLD
jgi:hypothetical protein